MTRACFTHCPDCKRLMLGQRQGGSTYPQPHDCPGDTCDLCGAPTHDSALCDTCAWDKARDAEDQRQHEAWRDAR